MKYRNFKKKFEKKNIPNWLCNLKHFSLAAKENSFTKAFFFRVLKKISLYESNKGFFFNQ
jgi:hypothetical protein